MNKDEDKSRWLWYAAPALFAILVGFPVFSAAIFPGKKEIPPLADLILKLFPHQLLCLAAALVFVSNATGGILQNLKIRRPQPGLVKEVLATGLVLIPTMAALTLITGLLMRVFGVSEPHSPLIKYALRLPPHLFLILACGAVIMAPVVEEIVFRRIIFGFLNENIKIPAASSLIITSFIFSIIHADPLHFPALMLLAAAMQRIYIKYDNLSAAIFLHSFNNFTGITVLFVLKSLAGDIDSMLSV